MDFVLFHPKTHGRIQGAILVCPFGFCFIWAENGVQLQLVIEVIGHFGVPKTHGRIQGALLVWSAHCVVHH